MLDHGRNVFDILLERLYTAGQMLGELGESRLTHLIEVSPDDSKNVYDYRLQMIKYRVWRS